MADHISPAVAQSAANECERLKQKIALLQAANEELRTTVEAVLFALDLESIHALAKYDSAYAPLRTKLRAALARAKQS